MFRAVITIALMLSACTSNVEPSFQYTVIRGDSLSKIAKKHDVTVAELKQWNELQDELIHPGQQIIIRGNPTSKDTTSRPKRALRKKNIPSSNVTGLKRPAPKKCLPPPSLEEADDLQFHASKGLSIEALRASMDNIIPHTLKCGTENMPTSGTIHTEIVVACTGQVHSVRVQDAGPFSDQFADCVRDTLLYASFPAHDYPDGYPFDYPLRFSF